VWNTIAGYIANATLQQMVERRKREMARGKFDATFEARTKIVENAWNATQTWLRNDERASEPIEVLEHFDGFGSGEDQTDLETARKAGRLPVVTDLSYAESDAGGTKAPKSIEVRTGETLNSAARFGRARRYV